MYNANARCKELSQEDPPKNKGHHQHNQKPSYHRVLGRLKCKDFHLKTRWWVQQMAKNELEIKPYNFMGAKLFIDNNRIVWL